MVLFQGARVPSAVLIVLSFSVIVGSTAQNIIGNPEAITCSELASSRAKLLPPFASPLSNHSAFQAAVAAAAASSSSCDVVLTLGNNNFLDMVSNFLMSLSEVGMPKPLVVALSAGVCENLLTPAECITYPKSFAEKADFGTPLFMELVHVKTEVALAVLSLGYSLLLVDGDIVFYKNPMMEFNSRAGRGFDVQIQDDADSGRNSGFMYLSATPATSEFLLRSLTLGRTGKGMRQQPAVNAALKELKSKLRVHVLSTRQYPCGKVFFESPRRMFATDSPCPSCVIVHNNWIFGSAGKVYRFKELLQWRVDRDGYYSSPTAKYLEFNTAAPNVSLADEAAALKTAFKIGSILGRIVILPKFNCHGVGDMINANCATASGCAGSPLPTSDYCAFNAHFRVVAMNAVFPNSYREHMFRDAKLVPANIKSNNHNIPVYSFLPAKPGTTHIPSSNGKVASATIISAVDNNAQLLRMEDLQHVDVELLSPADSRAFELRWALALEPSSIRQKPPAPPAQAAVPSAATSPIQSLTVNAQVVPLSPQVGQPQQLPS